MHTRFQNPIVSDLPKHVDLKYIFLLGHVTKGNINIHCVSSNQMISDLLTKSFKKFKNNEMVKMMKMA